jgi:hypothetical protein
MLASIGGTAAPLRDRILSDAIAKTQDSDVPVTFAIEESALMDKGPNRFCSQSAPVAIAPGLKQICDSSAASP